VRYSERVALSRRAFLQSAALVGLSRKGARRLEGSFVLESHELGHRLRDGRLPQGPRAERQSPVVIVGGGVAGLSAAWHLSRRGFQEFVVLEMESDAGGNARAGANDVSPYPWAAHYVPVPGPAAALARELFDDLGVRVDGRWDERHLCHAPQERLFVHGRWHAGFDPAVGPTRRDRDHVRRFDDLVAGFRARGHFTVPMGDAPPSPLDAMSMRAWLDREGLDSPWLRWLVDYACRDDYGALAADTSAWAGVHYFASREPDEQGPLTWPEGNAFVTRRLVQRFGGRVVTRQVVSRVERDGVRWRVETPDTRWTADVVIFAAPSFLASRIVEQGPSAGDFAYSPWVTANLTLDRWPVERGVPVAWDNVIVDSPSLGYVVATHQSLRTHIPRTVWTYYWALAQGSPSAQRQWLLVQSWDSLATRILDDLQRAHPDIRDCVQRLDICRMGHAMIRPTPGFLSSGSRQAMRRGLPRLFFAHSDVSGLSLFEEAQARGVAAAERAITVLSGRGE
jgi:glycine/D-amino acid oxidase-like deaminating enzyme